MFSLFPAPSSAYTIELGTFLAWNFFLWLLKHFSPEGWVNVHEAGFKVEEPKFRQSDHMFFKMFCCTVQSFCWRNILWRKNIMI
jgi:hypothetical protein